MASLIGKKKGNKLYYYVAESARVNGQPRIVNQTYLGSAERLATLVKDRSAPLPLEATCLDYGLPGALWRAAQQLGVFSLLESLWPKPRSGPSTAHYLLLAAIHRICAPGPKTEVPDWYEGTILRSLWGLEPDRFRSQDFWDCFDRIDTSPETGQLAEAQSRLLGLWRQQEVVSQRLLAYDTTNFYTWVASTNTRNQLAQRGHNKQGRHDLRQVGLSYVLDGERGLSLCHHLYPGNVTDADELPVALDRVVALLDRHQIPRSSVTLVLDKGSAALANTLELEKAGVGWISALPWNQAPPELRECEVEQLTPCSGEQPGVRAAAKRMWIHGQEYLCVVKYSASFASEQLHSLTTSMSKALQAMRRLAVELCKPRARYTEQGIHNKVKRWLAAEYLKELVRYEVKSHHKSGWRLQFDFNNEAFLQLLARRLGRTVLVTNRLDWSAEQVVAGYAGQQQIEKIFRGLKNGGWLGWSPMFHWTDSKIQVHAFYCMLGISLLQYLHHEAQRVWPGISMELLLEQLRGIQQFVLLYPPLGEKGPKRAAFVLSKRTLAQQSLSELFGLDDLRSTQRR